MILYDSPYLPGDGSIHSIDNIRLRLEFSSVPAVEHFLDFLSSFCAVYYSSLKDFSYRHLFVFGLKGHSFSVGVCFNGSLASDNLLGFIDYNPNKILGSIWYGDGFVSSGQTPFSDEELDSPIDLSCILSSILRYVQVNCMNVDVKRFDYAVDLPNKRNEVQLFKEDGRMYSQFWKSSEDFTEYLGRMNKGGRVKVYNKRIESELDYPLTRVEITCDSMDYDKFRSRFPKIYIRRQIEFGTQSVLIQLLSKQGPEDLDTYLRQMSPNTRKRYKAILIQKPYTVDRDTYSKVTDRLKLLEV